MYDLNRSSQISIDDETPDIVIVDLLSTCRKKVSPELLKERRKEILNFIKEFEREMDPIKPDMLMLATYVSPENQKWPAFNLWKAFCHLDSFLSEEPRLRKLRKKEVGNKTVQNPYTYDSIMLYHILQKNDLVYKPDDTLETMMDRINEKYEEVNRKSPLPQLSPVPLPKEVIVEKIVSVEVPSEKEVPPRPEDFDREKSFQKILNNLSDQNDDVIWKIDNCLQKIPPFSFKDTDYEKNKKISKSINSYGTVSRSCLSDQEAVIYGFKIFSFDFSEAPHPAEELKQYCQSKLDGKKYRPVSDEFADRYLLNKTWFNTEKTYKTHFSRLYSQKKSGGLIQYNGGNEEDSLDFFQGDDTFYKGIPPVEGYQKTVISFFENSDLGKDDTIISFGSGTTYIFFTPSELKEFFEKEKDFSNFRDRNQQLPIHAIRKLRNICNDNHSGEMKELNERIGFFLDTGKPSFPLMKDLMAEYIVYQKELEEFFVSLYKLGKDGIDKNEFTSRIGNIKVPSGGISKLLSKLPMISRGETRLYRDHKKLMECYQMFDMRKETSLTAKFYYENMTSEKLE